MYLPAYTVRNIPASGKHQTALLGNAVPHGLVRVARLVNDEAFHTKEVVCDR